MPFMLVAWESGLAPAVTLRDREFVEPSSDAVGRDAAAALASLWSF